MGDESQVRQTGAGAEAAEGIHAADRGRNPEDNSALEDADRQADGDRRVGASDRRGSEPTTSHATEHKSSYGGGGQNGGMK